MMKRNATLCELECRQRVIERFGDAKRTTFETAELYRKLT